MSAEEEKVRYLLIGLMNYAALSSVKPVATEFAREAPRGGDVVSDNNIEDEISWPTQHCLGCAFWSFLCVA